MLRAILKACVELEPERRLSTRATLCWNWKTALLSASLRAMLFAAVAWRAGPTAVFKVIVVELAITTVAAGFQGAITQALRGVEPAWRATLLCTLAVATINHPAEHIFHNWARSAHTHLGIALSLAYTLIATQLSLHLMRAGIFLAGAEGRPFFDDVRRLPRLLGGFSGLRNAAAPPAPDRS